MGKYVAENVVKKLIAAGKNVKDAKVAILGFTFKENCPDTRNTRVIDIVNELKEYGITPVIADPVADTEEGRSHYGLEFADISAVKDMDAVILAVAHTEFSAFSTGEIDAMFAEGDNHSKVLIDVKGVLDRKTYTEAGYQYWRL